eukprot:gene17135-23439_t
MAAERGPKKFSVGSSPGTRAGAPTHTTTTVLASYGSPKRVRGPSSKPLSALEWVSLKLKGSDLRFGISSPVASEVPSAIFRRLSALTLVRPPTSAPIPHPESAGDTDDHAANTQQQVPEMVQETEDRNVTPVEQEVKPLAHGTWIAVGTADGGKTKRVMMCRKDSSVDQAVKDLVFMEKSRGPNLFKNKAGSDVVSGEKK